MGWNDRFDCRSKSARETAKPFPPRSAAHREMVSGLVSDSLRHAVKDYAGAHKLAVYRVRENIGLGNTTWDRMVKAKPIAQSTALKILKFLGTDVRAVLTKYQQKAK